MNQIKENTQVEGWPLSKNLPQFTRKILVNCGFFLFNLVKMKNSPFAKKRVFGAVTLALTKN